jgi:hypothetical protein
MIENFEDADKTEAETKAQKATSVCDEGRPVEQQGKIYFN